MDEKYKILRILFPIGTLYPSQKGGPSNTVYWLAKGLMNYGSKVTCITTDLGIPKNTIPSDVWFSTDYGEIIYTKEKFHLFPIKLIRHTFKEIKKNEIIHLTSLFYPPSFIIAMLATILKKNVVWSVRGELDDKAMIYSSKKKKLIIWFVRLLTMKIKITFHSTCHAETKSVLKHFGDKVSIIELPNYLELPEKMDSNVSNTPYLLFIGRLHPKKAVENLIEALSKSFYFINSSFVLNIAGSGEDNYILKLLELVKYYNLSSKIFFIGHKESYEKQKLYAHAFFTFMPSHTENFGNVVVESLAQGTPVVASSGTPWEILEKINAGYWINNDAESLSKTIDEIIQLYNTDDYINMRKTAYEFSKTFDINLNVPKWISAYKSLLNE